MEEMTKKHPDLFAAISEEWAHEPHLPFFMGATWMDRTSRAFDTCVGVEAVAYTRAALLQRFYYK